MRRRAGRAVRWMSGLTALALALVSFIAGSVQTGHDKQKVTTMTAKMKTVCVGRFLIDVPVETQVSLSRVFAGGLDIWSTDRESDQQFLERMQQAEADMAKALNESGQPSLEASKALVVGTGQGKTFVHNRRRSKLLKPNGYVFNEILALSGMLRFPGVSITSSNDWVGLDYVEPLIGVLRRVRVLEPGEIPRQPGFCLEHAFIQDPYNHDNREGIAMFAGFPGHPDVNLVLSSEAGVAPAPGLLARNAKAASREPLFMQLAFTHLRERQRAISGMQGEELVMRIREPNFTTGYSFEWETRGRRDDIYAPVLKLELESGTNPVAGGKPVQSSLSEDALFALWESIVGSIRLRPVSTLQPDPEPPGPALGTVASAGEPCPHTGWWHCGDGGRDIGVFGGQRKFFKQGQRMPQALLLPQPTMWQRLRGVQPSFETTTPTLWSLADKRTSARPGPISGLEHPTPGAALHTLAVDATPSGLIQVPIGSIEKTGAPCPASGWWRCLDSNALDGTRWFAAGSLLPAATFEGPSHGRKSMHPELIHRRSSWLLMRLVDDVESVGGADAG